MKNNQVSNARRYFTLVLALATVITISLVHSGIMKAYGQSVTATTPGMNNTAMQQHAAHILDNLIISEHIPLIGQLTSGDYMLLMDFTPFATSVEGHSHIAMKAPCNQDGSPKVTIVAGVSPNLSTLNMGNAINNGTLNGKNLDLSNEGKSCLYRAELPNIALINTSNGTLNFNEGGYSVTVSVHGTAIQHIAK
jgi:acyl-[acyl carrier protein]--UDP-N-acetylglucosamine O-acyltransferase